MARDPPGARAICARNLSVPTGDTSMWYSRPLIVSSKRCTVTAEGSIVWIPPDARKRKEARRRIHMQHAEEIRTSGPQNFFCVSESPQAFHRSSTRFPQAVRTNGVQRRRPPPRAPPPERAPPPPP